MKDVASNMLNNASAFISANPQLVRTALLAGGAGALGGAMLTPTDEDEPASERVKKKLKNALLGATVAGGAGALLSNAAYNFGTAKLQRQLTPEEATEIATRNIGSALNPFSGNGWGLATAGGSAAAGAALGQFGVIGAGENSPIFRGDYLDKRNAQVNILKQVRTAKADALNELRKNKASKDAIDAVAAIPENIDNPKALKEWLKTKPLQTPQTAEVGNVLRRALSSAVGDDAFVRQLLDAGLDPKLLNIRVGKMDRLKSLLRRNKRTAAFATILPTALALTGAAITPGESAQE